MKNNFRKFIFEEQFTIVKKHDSAFLDYVIPKSGSYN